MQGNGSELLKAEVRGDCYDYAAAGNGGTENAGKSLWNCVDLSGSVYWLYRENESDLNDIQLHLEEKHDEKDISNVLWNDLLLDVGHHSQLFPDKLSGFVSIDSASLQRKYVTRTEIWLLKRMEPVYRIYPWKPLLKSGTNGVATTEYGRKLMLDMMMVYDGNQAWYAQLAGHGFRILAEAMEADLPYEIKCPALLICGKKDHAGSCVRYNKAWHKNTGIPIKWIENAGHNSNADAPEMVNELIVSFIGKIPISRK